MDSKRIIMNFTVPPATEDIEAMTASVFETLPDELLAYYEEGVSVIIDDIVDEADEQDLDLDDPFDLLALYKSGRQISPGVERKTANDEDILILYRRPVLDMWCETGEDLAALIRRIVIEELGRHCDFSDDEIEEMAERHYQGML